MRFLRTRSMQLFIDGLVVAVALCLAYAIRFEGFPPRNYFKQLLLVLPYVVLLRVGLFAAAGIYRLVWRYVSLRDVPRLLAGVGAGTLALVAARFATGPLFGLVGVTLNPLYSTVPFGVMAAELLLTTAGLVAVRASWRLYTERRTYRSTQTTEVAALRKDRALLIGAGSAGVMVAREVVSRPDVGFSVAGFIDDDQDKQGTVIHGLKVLGGTDRLAELAQAHEVNLVVISMASVTGATIRRIVDLATAAGLKVQIIPGLYEILSGRVNISKIRNVAIEDLLGREPVRLDEQDIAAFVTGKRVLVTGAGGSIGSELCRQICRFDPGLLVLLDQAENPLFHIHRELHRAHPELALEPCIANVVDADRLRKVFEAHQPQVVFHAAAHKHVPLMEHNPTEAVRNNVLGSRTVATLAGEHGASAFVMISTDKAVNPTSVMGATKRLAELCVQSLAARAQKTRYLTVRFGNVLGSEGSVIPIFREQIARGGPVTVTHPEMKRYFMTIPEASQLVLQASAMGAGGEIFVLEMGQPIHIVNLARDLIRLSGYEPDKDIAIHFTGMRPGEKLYEEINLSEENATKTDHPRIWVGQSGAVDGAKLEQGVAALVKLAQEGAEAATIRQALAGLVAEYRPNTNGGSAEAADHTDGHAGRDGAQRKLVDDHRPGADDRRVADSLAR